jgi:hypothetical protein
MRSFALSCVLIGGARYVDEQKQKQVAIDSSSVLLESTRVVVVADRDCC